MEDLLFVINKTKKEYLDWIEENEYSLDSLSPIVFADAVFDEDLELLTWLKEKECPWDSRTFYNAAEIYNFEIIKWLTEQGCPWDSEVFEHLLHNFGDEHTYIFEYLISNGCPCDDPNLYGYAYETNTSVLQMLKDYGGPLDQEKILDEPPSEYADNGSEIIEWFEKQGYPWGKTPNDKCGGGQTADAYWEGRVIPGFDLSTIVLENEGNNLSDTH